MSDGMEWPAELDQPYTGNIQEEDNQASLRKELRALVEGIVRAYARRRLKELISSMEVLEVEREGSWKLGDHIASAGSSIYQGRCSGENVYCDYCGEDMFKNPADDLPPFCPAQFELWWMSRHDALLLERSTNFLYLLSYKTTGSWDRRKRMDAEIDMQGLSEAVDVENRMAEAWRLIQAINRDDKVANPEFVDTYLYASKHERLDELVSRSTKRWLATQPAPPKIHAVRYEYLLKGQRREEKDSSPKRYIQDSPLIRAWKLEGITSEDRRWAATYKWWGIDGKGHTLPWKNWKKAAVWEFMTVREWVDLLDGGELQEDCYDDRGAVIDVLADQFVEPVTVYRSDDDMRDWLEQVEAQEVQVAIDAARVNAARDEGEKRSLLNRLFAQTRTSCCWPGACSYMKVCYGGEDIRRDPLGSSELFQVRTANHPIETAP